MGFLGVAYNRCILAALNLTSRFSRFRGTLRAAIIAALVAGVGWFMPLLIGAGDVLTQTVLDGRLLIGALDSFLHVVGALSPIPQRHPSALRHYRNSRFLRFRCSRSPHWHYPCCRTYRKLRSLSADARRQFRCCYRSLTLEKPAHLRIT